MNEHKICRNVSINPSGCFTIGVPSQYYVSKRLAKHRIANNSIKAACYVAYIFKQIVNSIDISNLTYSLHIYSSRRINEVRKWSLLFSPESPVRQRFIWVSGDYMIFRCLVPSKYRLPVTCRFLVHLTWHLNCRLCRHLTSNQCLNVVLMAAYRTFCFIVVPYIMPCDLWHGVVGKGWNGF